MGLFDELIAAGLPKGLLANPGQKAKSAGGMMGWLLGGPATMEPDLQTKQLGGVEQPEGAAGMLDSGQWVDAQGNVIPEAPISRRPGVLPLTRDAETGQVQPALPRALDLMGNALPSVAGSAVAPVAMRAGETVLGAGPIRAYHGSPHDFDRFDLSKIGTGEGAQAYGHGLYFAENPETAQYYKDVLSVTKGAQDSHQVAKKVQSALGLTTDYAPYSVLQQLSAHPADVVRKSAPDHWKPVIDYIEANGLAKPGGKGKMYEVAIHADPERFLDWDKPLAAQATPVKKALSDITPYLYENDTGRAAWDALSRRHDFAGPQAAQEMRSREIPGIRYLDQGSRTAGDGSRNYVTFDDKIVEILRKYGVAGLSTAGAGYGGLGGLGGYQPQQGM